MDWMESLSRVDARMQETRAARAAIVRRLLDGPPLPAGQAPGRGLPARLEETLRAALDELRAIDRLAEPGRLSCEIGELEKDLRFLRLPPPEFRAFLAGLHPGLREEVEAGAAFLDPSPPVVLCADRDGTLNNYCARYRSSIQSAWNGLFLSRYARRRTRAALILTSAPLEEGGLLEVSVLPPGLFSLAGSKGREILDREGRRHRLPPSPQRQERLEALNRALERLLAAAENRIFTLVGSGVQRKLGQTTVARQDIHGTVPGQDSARFLERLRELVREQDPRGEWFRLEDTGLDVELVLTVDEGGEGGAAFPRGFDKGDGITFADRTLGLGLERGPNLIAGDTAADLAMVRAAMGRSRDTRAVFVTRDEELRRQVAAACPRPLFVGEPDTLVLLLERLAGGAATKE